MSNQSDNNRNSISDRFQRVGFLAARLQDGQGLKSETIVNDSDPSNFSAHAKQQLLDSSSLDSDPQTHKVDFDFITRAKFKKRALERRIQGRVSMDHNLPQFKLLEEMHWLEMIDTRHRYGANLKWYHKKWADSTTHQNFFRW